MVQIYQDDILYKLRNLYPRQRMPLLYSVNHSYGWRIISENEEHTKSICSEHFNIIKDGENENYLTCLAISENIGMVVIGSGSKDGLLYFIKDMSAIKDDFQSGTRFELIHKEVLHLPIYSLDWVGSYLLVGTNQGIIRVYKVELEDDDTLKAFTMIGQYTNPLPKPSLYSPSYNINTHVKAVEFVPNYNSAIPNQFLSTTANRLIIWKLQNEEEPLRSFEPSQFLLNCASWSPNDPQTLVVCGGYDKRLSIIDTRTSSTESPDGLVWSAENAHDRPITDAKFNPFIPYWLASAGEDAIVNIWDIRATYHAPVAKIDGNDGIVTSICWSNI
ncbi:WD40-repeat-containing domain protein [Cokeromyces recurvatus]|uniref:WD40-repeat-containing domain protein n=1 Tax=Cokeromyces recurvatus TaxID=90255 RepID=UPI00221F6F3C|nr:WD40-repeat-containing domain protein [Cokeromyces recurvatus]KAI7902775.1 WD40-repeat-containing domain protein [Cokeromyces recurvatus]